MLTKFNYKIIVTKIQISALERNKKSARDIRALF